ncbi:MAG: YidC/Oxa1 family membrane protein insertase [Erysipelotrichaceae bacterium]|nr:YidC/Oxa1 family membrane protein insertase [Erysipelotrichaceae bacterium]
MKKVLSNKKVLLVLLAVAAMFLLAGCQRNVDANGNTLPERIISLDTPWKNVLNESFFSAIFVWPLAQCINWIGGKLNSAVLGVLLTTVLFNLLTLGITKKSTVSMQKIQLLQPEMQKINQKYEGLTDDNSRRKQASEMQALYNKYGVDPLGSMITPFIQIPIMISMYYAVQRAAVVVEGKLFGIPLSTTPKAAFKSIGTQWPIVVVFALMIVAQLLSSLVPQWMAKKKKKSQKGYKAYADNSTNSTTNTTMIMMVLMVAVLGAGWPSTMSIYWLVSSICNVLKTLYIQWRYIDNEKV